MRVAKYVIIIHSVKNLAIYGYNHFIFAKINTLKVINLIILHICYSLSMNSMNLSTDVYYIKNESYGMFLGGGNKYGTELSILTSGEPFYVKQQAGESYSLENLSFVQYRNDQRKFVGLFQESAKPSFFIDYYKTDFYIKEVSNENIRYITQYDKSKRYYTISFYNVDGDLCYLSVGESGKGNSYIIDGKSKVESESEIWTLYTRTDIIEEAKQKATDVNPFELTMMINDPNFSIGRSDLKKRNFSFWEIESEKPVITGMDYNYCASAYNRKFKWKQSIESLPNGRYIIMAQAVYTNLLDKHSITPYVFAQNKNEIVISGFINSKIINFMPNGEEHQYELSDSFINGKYQITPININIKDETLTIGVYCDEPGKWCVWDNFRLLYLGR